MFHRGTARETFSQVLMDLSTHGSPPRTARHRGGMRALVVLALAAAFVFGAAGIAQAETVVPDPNLANAINAQLGHTYGSEITTADMASLYDVYAWFSPISSLEGMQYATNLRSISLYGSSVSDVSPLASCTALTQVNLDYDSNLSNISALAGLPNLTEVGLESDRITDVTPLSGLTNLSALYLYNNQVSDVAPLAGLTNLSTLDVGYNQDITDITPLAGMTQMTSLYLEGNQIADIGTVSGLSKLYNLDVDSNGISDLSPVSDLTGLNYLSFAYNEVTTITPVAGLTDLININCSGNQISDITPMAGLTKMQSLNIGQNQISDITPLSAMTDLNQLTMYYNQVADLAPLAGLTKLSYLQADSNLISDLTPLSGLTGLTELDLYSDQVTDLTPLAGMSNMSVLGLGYDNGITDLTPLAGLTSMTRLYLEGDSVADVSPLQNMTKLTELVLNNNQVADISSLSGLTSLTSLVLGENHITDISAVAGMTNLRTLSIENNGPIADITAVSGLTNLSTFSAGGDGLTDITPLAGLTNLQNVDLVQNRIADISALSGLKGLNYLNLQYNRITDATPLAGLSRLYYVYIWGNDLDVSEESPAQATFAALHEANNTQVYYDPQNPLLHLTYSATDGGTIEGVTDQQVWQGSDGTTVTAVAGPDHLFVGWSDGRTEPSRCDTNVVGDFGAQAIFAPVSGTLTYVAGEGGSIEGPASQFLDYGATGQAVTAVPDIGHHFVGWSDEGESATRSDVMSGDATYTASFDVDIYRLAFDGNGGFPEKDSAKGIYGRSVGEGMPDQPVRDGYTFAGWNTQADGSGDTFTGDTVVEGPMTLYAQWTAQTGTLTYDANEGGSIEGSSTQVLAYGATGEAVTAVPDTGYHFTGWSDEGEEAMRSDVMSGDARFTASFGINIYEVVFEGNGGSPESAGREAEYGFRFGEEMPTPPVRDGYTFAGWNTKADGSGAVFDGSTPVVSEIALYAQWTANVGTLTYTANEGGSIEGPTTQVLVYGATGDAVTAVPDPGHHFTGWSDESDSVTRSDVVSGDAQFTASFDVDIYRIVFDGNGGSPESDGCKAEYGRALGEEMPDQPTRDGYTFAGWNTKADGSGESFDGSTVVESEITLYAQWTANTATVHYVAGEGGSIEGSCTQVVAMGSCADTVTAIPDAGYRFVGWNDESSSAQRADLVSGDATFIASFALDIPSDPTNVTFGIVSTKSTRVNWIGPRGAAGFNIYLAGILLGTAGPDATSFTIPSLLGPNANVTVEAEGVGPAHSDRVRAAYVATTSVKVATVRFAGGSSELSATAKRILSALAQQVKTQGFKTLTINGYVRKALSLSASKRLSLARALSVKAYLIARFKALHVSVSIRTNAMGYSNPVGGNPFAQANHRAEAILR